uniref:Uncharacterized protein n=1 Tax=Digenea simplex TaxID=945030 RepID=A0A1Z1MV05_DIGSM|nr:hypothetical protein [Digenea simplex]ARW69514.1 hypothetical protein [Digenea simplex]
MLLNLKLTNIIYKLLITISDTFSKYLCVKSNNFQ